MEKYIFISYSHKDTDLVLPIINRLKQDGYNVWYDDGIEIATNWEENIAEKLCNCNCMIAMISKNYIASSYCKDEINFARDKNIKVIMSYIDEAELSMVMRLRFGRNQAIYKNRISDDEYFRWLYEISGFGENKRKECEVPASANNVPSEVSPAINTAGFEIKNGVLIKYTGKDEVVTIPDIVSKIGYGAFKDCTNITSITIPDSVTDIADFAFEDCKNLTSIIIPDSVTEIGWAAFNGCSELTSVTISNNITEIKSATFEDCSELTSITIPDNVTEIKWSAFRGCTNLM